MQVVLFVFKVFFESIILIKVCKTNQQLEWNMSIEELNNIVC
jgi:hypothetical protein